MTKGRDHSLDSYKNWGVEKISIFTSTTAKVHKSMV